GGGEQRLYVLEREGEQERGGVSTREDGEEPVVAGGDRVVEDQLRDPGSDELERGAGEEHEDGEGDAVAVRPEVAEQPSHETAVVRLAECLLFVRRLDRTHLCCCLRSSRCRRLASFADSPGSRSLSSTPPMKAKPPMRRTGASGSDAGGGRSMYWNSPMTAIPLISTASPGGTMISVLPMTVKMETSVTPGGSATSRKSSSTLPMMETARLLAAGLQCPLRTAVPMTATTGLRARLCWSGRTGRCATVVVFVSAAPADPGSSGRSATSPSSSSRVVARWARSIRRSNSSTVRSSRAKCLHSASMMSSRFRGSGIGYELVGSVMRFGLYGGDR